MQGFIENVPFHFTHFYDLSKIILCVDLSGYFIIFIGCKLRFLQQLIAVNLEWKRLRIGFQAVCIIGSGIGIGDFLFAQINNSLKS